MIRLVSKLTEKEYIIEDGSSVGGKECSINITDDPRTLATFSMKGRGLFIKMIDNTQIFINDDLPLYPHTKFYLYNNDEIKIEGFAFNILKDEINELPQSDIRSEVEFELESDIAESISHAVVRTAKENTNDKDNKLIKKVISITKDIESLENELLDNVNILKKINEVLIESNEQIIDLYAQKDRLAKASTDHFKKVEVQISFKEKELSFLQKDLKREEDSIELAKSISASVSRESVEKVRNKIVLLKKEINDLQTAPTQIREEKEQLTIKIGKIEEIIKESQVKEQDQEKIIENLKDRIQGLKNMKIRYSKV